MARIFTLYAADGVSSQRYLHWDEIRYKRPPHDLAVEEWWVATKFARRGMYRRIPLVDKAGHPFVYALPDEVLKQTDYIASYASGQIRLSEQVTDPATRDRYLVSQLIEEAITSSQLEGASTSRKVARDMIRSGRQPRDRSEQMILNNFHAMQRIGELRHEKLTIDLICEIHKIVTEGTLENSDAAGRFQLPEEDRVAVWAEENQLLHSPPPADQLPERMQRLCDFANAQSDTGYLPGALRALVIHFMIGYEHPFEDGNGRTARALFYWSMLNQGYWLTEFLSVSRILKRAPGKYARSFLYTETDENDLTYFFIYNLNVLHRAIDELHAYLAHKMAEVREVRRTLRQSAENFNPRQLALLQHALKNPTTRYSVQSHKTSHRVSTETARSDLIGLESMGLLTKRKSGKRYVFDPIPDLGEAIKQFSG
ncbi:Fic family protein [Micromonospora sp. NBC_00389]|uniref:Fic family protein n=1 Tax=Micromonospora sp. NBC_00389 TaxID=2903586 RepID=UPI002E241989